LPLELELLDELRPRRFDLERFLAIFVLLLDDELRARFSDSFLSVFRAGEGEDSFLSFFRVGEGDGSFFSFFRSGGGEGSFLSGLFLGEGEDLGILRALPEELLLLARFFAFLLPLLLVPLLSS